MASAVTFLQIETLLIKDQSEFIIDFHGQDGFDPIHHLAFRVDKGALDHYYATHGKR